MGAAMNTLGTKAFRLLRYGNRKARLLRLVNRLEMRLKRPRLITHPPFLCIEPGAVCNLRCPCCPTGERTSKLGGDPLGPEVFERIAANLRLGSICHVDLYRLGEPLLNPHLCDYIAFFSKRGIVTSISVNFSARDYDTAFMERLVRSGLSRVVVSVDGTTQDTYAKYRVGGDLERVLNNIRGLAQAKQRLAAETPRIVYKMLLTRHNQHQVEEARRLASELGAEFYLPHFFHTSGNMGGEWTADGMDSQRQTCVENADPRHRTVDTECKQLWDTLNVHANGDVFPCCFCADPAHAAGNLVRDPIGTIWNNDKMRALRRYVTDPEAPAPDFANPCVGCEHRYCTFWR